MSYKIFFFNKQTNGTRYQRVNFNVYRTHASINEIDHTTRVCFKQC